MGSVLLLCALFSVVVLTGASDRSFWYVAGSYHVSDCGAVCSSTAHGGHTGMLAMIRSAGDNTRAYEAMKKADPTSTTGFLNGHRFNHTCENSGDWMWTLPNGNESEFYFKFSAAADFEGTCEAGSFCNFAAGEPNGYCTCGPTLVNVTTCCVGVTCSDCGTIVYACANTPGETVLTMFGPGTNATVAGQWNDVNTDAATGGCICQSVLTSTKSLLTPTETRTVQRDTASPPLTPSTSITVTLQDQTPTLSSRRSASRTPSITATVSSGATATITPPPSHTEALSASNSTSQSPTISRTSSVTFSRSASSSEAVPTDTRRRTPSGSPSTSWNVTLTETVNRRMRHRGAGAGNSATLSAPVSTSALVSSSESLKPKPTTSKSRHRRSHSLTLVPTSSGQPTVSPMPFVTHSLSFSRPSSMTLSPVPSLSGGEPSPSHTVSFSPGGRSRSRTETRLHVTLTSAATATPHAGKGSRTQSFAGTWTHYRSSHTAKISRSVSPSPAESETMSNYLTVSRLKNTMSVELSRTKTYAPTPLPLTLTAAAKLLGGFTFVMTILSSVASFGGHSFTLLQAAAVVAHSPGAPEAASVRSTPLVYALCPFWDYGMTSAVIANLGIIAAVFVLQFIAVNSEQQPLTFPGDEVDEESGEVKMPKEDPETRKWRRWAECWFPNGAMLVTLLGFPGVAAASFSILFHDNSANLVVGIIGLVACLAAFYFFAVWLPVHWLPPNKLPPFAVSVPAARYVILHRGSWITSCTAADLNTHRSFQVAFSPFVPSAVQRPGLAQAAAMFWVFVMCGIGGAKSTDASQRQAQFAMGGLVSLVPTAVLLWQRPYRTWLTNVCAVMLIFLLAAMSFTMANGNNDAADSAVIAIEVVLCVLCGTEVIAALVDHFEGPVPHRPLQGEGEGGTTIEDEVPSHVEESHMVMMMGPTNTSLSSFSVPMKEDGDDLEMVHHPPSAGFLGGRSDASLLLPNTADTAAIGANISTTRMRDDVDAPMEAVTNAGDHSPVAVAAEDHHEARHPIEPPPREVRTEPPAPHSAPSTTVAPADNDDFFSDFASAEKETGSPQPPQLFSPPSTLRRDAPVPLGSSTLGTRAGQAPLPKRTGIVVKSKPKVTKKKATRRSSSSSSSTSSSSLSDDSDL